MGRCLGLLIFTCALLVSGCESRISDAAELECGFEFPCQWFNGTNGLEDTVDWNTALAVALGNWNNLPILGLSKNSTGSCLEQQLKSSRTSKIAFSADCAESQSLTFMATTKTGTDVYSYAIGSAGATAWLVSSEIPKQIGAGILSFSYWKSRNAPTLRVCGRKPPGYPNGLDCSWYNANDLYQGQTWVQDRVIIPPSDAPFEIVILAQFAEPNTFVAIDELQYKASVGDNSPSSITPSSILPSTIAPSFGGSAPGTSNRLARLRATVDRSIPVSSDIIPLRGDIAEPVLAVQPNTTSFFNRQVDSSAPTKVIGAKLQIVVETTKCPQVACDFDTSLCQYRNVPSGGNWRHTEKRISNRATAIESDFNGSGGFAFAMQALPLTNTFILSTPQFITTLPGVLTYNYYMAGGKGRLRLCQQTLENCTLIAENESGSAVSPQNFNAWQSEEVEFPAGLHQLFFISDHMERHFISAIDNVQVWDKSKTFELECFRN